MLTKKDLQSIRMIMGEEIDFRVPPMINKAIDEKVPGIVIGIVTKIIDERVPQIVMEINEKSLIPAIVVELSGLFDVLDSHATRIGRLERIVS